MRIRRQAATAHFLAETVQVVLAESALEECPAVDARRRVPLDKDEIAFLGIGRAAPEMVEADFI